MKFRNISKLGDLDVAGVGFVPYGETFEAVGDEAEPFKAQPDVYEHVVEPRADSKADKADDMDEES